MLLFIELVLVFPDFLTVNRFHVLCVANGVRIAIIVLSAPDTSSLVLLNPVLTTTIFTHSLLGKFALTTLVNVALCLVSIYAFCVLGQDPIDTNPSFDNTAMRLSYVHSSLGVVVFSSMFCWWVEQSTLLEVRDRIEQHDAMKAKELTVQSLLAVLCDAVVSLDAHLNIHGPAEKLRALLLIPSSNQRSFPDLMTTSDAERFRNHIRATKPGVHAQALNVHLRCANGFVLPVRLFHACFQDVERGCVGNLRYIIGVQELDPQSNINAALDDGPELPVHVVSSAPSSAGEVDSPRSAAQDAGMLQNDPSDSDGLHSSASTGESETFEVSKVLVQIDPLSLRSEVRNIVMKFAPSSLHLADMVDAVDANAWPAFQKWVEAGFNTLSYSDGSSYRNFGSVRLWWPWGDFELKAKSAILCDVDGQRLTIEFKGLQRLGIHSRQSGSGSNRSAQSQKGALASISEIGRV